jgi:hypothetical protein
MAYGVYDPSGATRVTVIDGSTLTGLYAADGSLNVVVSTPSIYAGTFHACGALNVTLTTTYTGYYAPNGSMYVAESSGLGALYVIAVSGSLGGSGLSTPVLAMHPSWVTTDNEPDFTITVDDTVVAGDDVRLQVQVAGGDWSSPVSDTTHEITVPEDAANAIDLALAALPNANYEARANVTDGAVTSNWSNTVSFTIAAVVSNAVELEDTTDLIELEDTTDLIELEDA